MKKASKSGLKNGLKMQPIILIFIPLAIMATSTQILINNNKNQQVAQLKSNEETQIATISTSEREINATTRSEEERKIEQEQPKYIEIEEIEISKDMDLTQRCGVSKEDFQELMSNLRQDKSGFFEANSDTIYDLCEQYDLNEIFFCGLIVAESGWNIASNHSSTHNYISMMSGGKLIRYSSEEEGLEAAARLLHNNYLSEEGSYYCGETLSCVQKRFCPNSSTWVSLVFNCMSQIINN